MRFIIAFILSFLFFIANAQFTNNHSFGGYSTLETIVGGLKVNRGIVNSIYADTATANLNPIANYPAGMIFVNDTIYIRDVTGTRWIKQAAGGGSGSGSVANVSGVNTNGFTFSIANPTTTPAITLGTSVSGILKGDGGAITAATDGTDYLSPSSLTASDGLTFSINDIKLGGLLGTPAELVTNRQIDLNSNVFYITKGDFTPDLDAFDERYTPLYTHLIDTVPSNAPAYSSTLPKSGGNWTREIRFAPNVYKANNRYGWRMGLHYRAGDSIVIRTDGGDYGNAFIAETRFTPAVGKTGRSVVRIGNGTGADKRANEGVASIVANMFIEGTDGTKYMYVRGFWTGVRPYVVIANGATDTVENIVYYSLSSFVSNPSWILKAYAFRPDVYYSRVDSIFTFFDTTTISASGKSARSYIAGKIMLGKSALGTWSLPHTLAVNGGSLFTDTANYHTNIAARYSARSLVDKNYVDSSIAASGGGGSSLFPVTGTGTATGNVIGELDGNSFTVQQNGTNLLTIDPNVFQSDFTTYDGTGQSQLLLVSNVSGGDVIFRLTTTDDINLIQIDGNAVNNTLQYQAGSHTFTGSVILDEGSTAAGSAFLYFTDGVVLTSAAEGAWEFDGVVAYFTTESGRGVVPSKMFAVLASNNTLADNNSAQSVFSSSLDVWTLQGSTTYVVKGTYYISTGGGNVSVGMGFALGGGMSLTSIRYNAISVIANAGAGSTAQLMSSTDSEASFTVTSSSATALKVINFEGVIRVNAGGTITPQITFSAAPGGTNQTLANSYIEFTPIGSSSVTSVGSVN